MVLDLLALAAQLSGKSKFSQNFHFFTSAAAVFWPLMILLDKEKHNSDADNIIVWALPAGLVNHDFPNIYF